MPTSCTQSFEVIVKPVHALCNMRCDYCYYRHDHISSQSNRRMSFAVLRQLVHQVVRAAEAFHSQEVIFNWHGGEPLLAGLDFYERAVEIQRECSTSIRIVNIIQTNGTLLDETWVRFLAGNRFVIGVSLDGPAWIHDGHRVDLNGRGTHARVTRGIELLRSAGVEPSVLLVVHDETAQNPDGIHSYCHQLGLRKVDLLPCVAFSGRRVQAMVESKSYGSFLIRMFDLWLHDNDPDFEIRFFVSALHGILGGKPLLCTMRGNACGFPSIIPSGDVYFCDSLETCDAFLLGNLLDVELERMWTGEQAGAIRQMIGVVKASCSSCPWFYVCGGGCSAAFQALYGTEGGDFVTHPLCAAFRMIFPHIHKRILDLQSTHQSMQAKLGQQVQKPA